MPPKSGRHARADADRLHATRAARESPAVALERLGAGLLRDSAMAVRNALAVGLIALALPARAQTVDVVVKTALDPAQGAVVGQAVALYVDVLFPGTMPRPPRVRIPDVQGAQVMRFESQGVTIGENTGGRNYVGQRFTFEVFPRRGGALTLPAAEITLLDVAGDVSGSTKGNPMTLDVAVPQGVDASGPVIASTRVTAVQTWAPDPATGLAPGGAIVRTITREAADVPALGMPELTFATPDGVRAYVDPPVSADRIDRGAVTGHRIDKVTYVFERSGAFDLPALSQPWWDLGAKSVRSVALNGATVTVSAAPASTGSRVQSRWSARAWLMAAAILATVLACLAVIVRYGWPKAHETWLAWQRRRAASEQAARRDLCRIARTGDAAATYHALGVWRSRTSPSEAEQITRHEPLRVLTVQLERSLFCHGGEPWTSQLGRALAQAVSSVPTLTPRNPHGSALPPLNPVAGS